MALALATPSAERNEEPRLQQFQKTKMCKFHLLGMCVKGTGCMFAHTANELQTPPDLRCTKMCKRLVDTGVCGDKDCSFAHNANELRTNGAFHKTKLCRFNQLGHCALGSKCNFAHSPLELQQFEALEGQNKMDTSSRSAKVSCADEVLLDTPPGLGEDDWVSAPPFYPQSEMSESPSWVATAGNPAYLPLPGSYSPHANPFAYGCTQDMNMACYSAYGNFASMWGLDTLLGTYADIEVDQADDLWQLKTAFMGGVQPHSIRMVRTSETTLCTLGDKVDEHLSNGLKTKSLVN